MNKVYILNNVVEVLNSGSKCIEDAKVITVDIFESKDIKTIIKRII